MSEEKEATRPIKSGLNSDKAGRFVQGFFLIASAMALTGIFLKSSEEKSPLPSLSVGTLVTATAYDKYCTDRVYRAGPMIVTEPNVQNKPTQYQLNCPPRPL